MGLSAKLNFAFITVVVTMVVGASGYSFVLDYLGAKSTAEHKLDQATNRLTHDFDRMSAANQHIATLLGQDIDFNSAYLRRDRTGTAEALQAFINRTGFDGFITILDRSGTVFYSTETPAKFGFSVHPDNCGIDYVLNHNEPWRGPAMLSAAGTLSVTAMVPIPDGTGIITANQALNSEFITGTVTRFGIGANRVGDIDLAVVSAKEGKIIAITPGLYKNNDGFLSKVAHDGFKVIPLGVFETSNHMWRSFLLAQTKSDVLGTVLISTYVESVWNKIPILLGQALFIGGFALALGFFFAASITGSIEFPLKFLIQRTRDLAAQKPVLPPLEGLSGEWLELGEFIDTAVSSMRTTIQNLKGEITRGGGTGQNKQSEAYLKQLDGLNQQLSTQAKQLTELSRQIHYANQQTILLQQKLEAALQISTEGFLILDAYGNVISANPVFLNWIGASEAEIAGQHCFVLVQKPDSSHQLEYYNEAFSRHGGNPDDLLAQFYPEGIIQHRYQQKAIEVLVHLQPVLGESGQTQSWIMVLRDKSLRSESVQLREDIVSLLSESIRKPLVELESSWQAVMANAPSTTTGQPLAQLHNHYQKLINVVDSLLMVYGGFIPATVQQREQVQVTRLVADTLEELSEYARQHQVMLDYKTGTGLPPLYTDRNTLHSILSQVLEKMIPVTASGGRVRVESLIQGSEMRVGVLSSGPALSEDEIADMFVGFIEGKHDEASYSSRLSMYLTRNNVERLGGKIWAESEDGRGTSIYILLPENG